MIETDGFLPLLENEVMASWRRRSRNQLYRTEPEAWLWDVLGLRWHAKQREIAASFVENRRIATKSSNGAGKSRQMGEFQCWGIATHEPGELLIIASAPTLRQIEETTFAYLASNYSRAKARNAAFPGYLTDSTHWNFRESPRSKAKTLVIGQRPSDRDIVGTFQGIRAVSDKETKTWVTLDEGGALPDDIFVAAEAVTTGAGDNKICTIGNPDRIGVYFQKIFEDETIKVDWATHTISFYDLPTHTGEIVYDDPEMQRMMLSSGMIDQAWVEKNGRAWGIDSARYRSKVLGLFPDADDWSFYSQHAINIAEETQIHLGGDEPRVLGVDLADGGEDDSKAYLNLGGKVRHHSTWNEGSQSPNRIHEAALQTEATIVVMDRMGVGGGPFHTVAARADRYYTVIGAAAGERSSDPARWANKRAEWYDKLREGMLNGEVDLDFYAEGPNGELLGKQLREQFLSIRYDFNAKGAIQIEPKKEARKRGVSSPDDLDAVAFAYSIQAKVVIDNPLAAMKPGDQVLDDPWDEELLSGAGLPI